MPVSPFRAHVVALLVLLSACATSRPAPQAEADGYPPVPVVRRLLFNED